MLKKQRLLSSYLTVSPALDLLEFVEYLALDVAVILKEEIWGL